MSRLPPHHVPRPRLTERCSGAVVVVVEAAAGYGKTVFASELVEGWGVVPVEVLLEPGQVSSDLLGARLRAAVARSGFTDAHESMNAAGPDPAGAIDAMLDALRDEPCAIIIDDAHHAARDAGLLIDRIAARITPPQCLVVLARQLPEGAERLRRAEAVLLTEEDLALRAEETLALCHAGFGLDVSAEEARLLDAATAGWTAAAVLAVSRAKRGDTNLRAIEGVGGRAGQLSVSVGAILDELLAALGPARSQIAQIARLPLFDRQLCATVTGEPDLFDRARTLGLPMTPAGDGWWELPGPIRDHLARLATPDAAALVRAANLYRRRGQLRIALQVLLSAGAAEPAAEILAEAEIQEVEQLDALELLALLDSMPAAAVDRHPWARFNVARACGVAALLGEKRRMMAWLDTHVRAEDDAALRRAIDAELAIDALNGESPADVEALGRLVLEHASADEHLTRARALTVVGFALCWRREPDGAVSEHCLREASRYLAEASDLYRTLGYRAGMTGAVMPRAIWTELGAGRAASALELLDAAVIDCAGQPRRIGVARFQRASVLTELGRLDEADADCEAAEEIGRRLADSLIRCYSHWGRMATASLRGDAELTLHHAVQLEAVRGDWWSVIGAEALAEAADNLDRVGLAAEAWDRLSRAQEDGVRGERWIAMSECALLARHGDPILAEERLSTVHRHGIYPRERWRVTLLRAYAALRRGDPGAGPLAVRAFEQAAELGQPKLPLVRERALTEALLALALESGSPVAAALEASSLPLALAVLGRFELTSGGRPIALRVGQGSQLLKLVAVSGGAMHVERAIEELWPESAPATGRNRLRTVLGRLREDAPGVIHRDGELLRIGQDVRVDLEQFTQEARQALATSGDAHEARVAVAQSAIARYTGDLLPHDLYEEWADAPREQVRRTMLELLDMCAAAAARRGDLDEARRMVERTIELAPHEDDRYLRVAEILREQGRTGAALSVLRRARSTLDAVGVPLPPELRDFEDSIVV